MATETADRHDRLFKAARWLRQLRLIADDPLALDARIDPCGRLLQFTHLYASAHVGETQRWLASPVYAGEASKQDPIDICHIAMDRFHLYLEHGDLAAREGFIAVTHELLTMGRTVVLDGRTCFVVPHFDQIEGYRPHSRPWVNAMVQGWVGALFMRAHQLTGEDEFARAALRAVGPCFVPVENGGVRAREAHGRVFYEKYAVQGQSRHVLNGFMASLLGIWDVARATNAGDAHTAFEQGLATLDDTVLATYDTGYTTLYDQRPERRATPSSVFYTWVHARQLAALARISGQDRLLKWAERWRAYSQRPEFRARTAFDTTVFRMRNLPRYIGLTRRDAL